MHALNMFGSLGVGDAGTPADSQPINEIDFDRVTTVGRMDAPDMAPCSLNRLMKESKCELSVRPFSEIQAAEAHHFADDRQYNEMIRTNLMKEENMTKRQSLVPTEDGWITSAECNTPTATGSWHTQRVGPFQSIGGGDWWTISWFDFGSLGKPVPDDPYRIVRSLHWSNAVVLHAREIL